MGGEEEVEAKTGAEASAAASFKVTQAVRRHCLNLME